MVVEKLKSILYNSRDKETEVKKTISKKIKKVLVDEDMQTTDLAKLLDCTPENLYLKLKRDNWKESDVQKIADVLGYEYIQELRKRR